MMHRTGLAAFMSGLLATVSFAAEPALGGSSPSTKVATKATAAAPRQLPQAVTQVAWKSPQPAANAVDRPATVPAPCPCVARPILSFMCGNDRYDPMIRDIRLVPNSRMLPGGDFGRRETLPVLPAREFGFFVTPRQ